MKRKTETNMEKASREWDEEKWTGEKRCMWSSKIARHSKDNDNTKSGQLRRRG